MSLIPSASYTPQEVLAQTKSIAVVGISDKPDRPSFGVAQYLAKHFQIIPINPNLTSWQGQKCYASLAQVPAEVRIDLVDVFRAGDQIMPVVEESIARGVPSIWLQLGVTNPAAVEVARKAGLTVVENACTAVVHSLMRKG